MTQHINHMGLGDITSADIARFRAAGVIPRHDKDRLDRNLEAATQEVFARIDNNNAAHGLPAMAVATEVATKLVDEI